MTNPGQGFWFVLMDPTDFSGVAHVFGRADVKRGSTSLCTKAIADSDGRAYQTCDAAVAASNMAAVQRCRECEALFAGR